MQRAHWALTYNVCVHDNTRTSRFAKLFTSQSPILVLQKIGTGYTKHWHNLLTCCYVNRFHELTSIHVIYRFNAHNVVLKDSLCCTPVSPTHIPVDWGPLLRMDHDSGTYDKLWLPRSIEICSQLTSSRHRMSTDAWVRPPRFWLTVGLREPWWYLSTAS